MFDFTDHVVIVTGAAAGIGRAIAAEAAAALARAGHRPANRGLVAQLFTGLVVLWMERGR